MLIQNFVFIYVTKYFNYNTSIPQINNMQILCSFAFSLRQNTRSYLLLVHARMHGIFEQEILWPDNTIARINQYFLVAINLIHCMANVFVYLLDKMYHKNVIYKTEYEDVNSTIQGLIEASNMDSHFIAAKLLSLTVQSRKKYDKIEKYMIAQPSVCSLSLLARR